MFSNIVFNLNEENFQFEIENNQIKITSNDAEFSADYHLEEYLDACAAYYVNHAGEEENEEILNEIITYTYSVIYKNNTSQAIDWGTRTKAIEVLVTCFSKANFTQRQKILEIIQALRDNPKEDESVLSTAKEAFSTCLKNQLTILSSELPHMNREERDKIFTYLMKQTDDEDGNIRQIVIESLGICCRYEIPEKRFEILNKINTHLNNKHDKQIRLKAIEALVTCFIHVDLTGRQKILEIIQVLRDNPEEDDSILSTAKEAFSTCLKNQLTILSFELPHINREERDKTFTYLMKQTDDKDDNIRKIGIESLGVYCKYEIPEKRVEILSKINHQLHNENDASVRCEAINAFVICFDDIELTERQTILKILQILRDNQEENEKIRSAAKDASFTCFQKQQTMLMNEFPLVKDKNRADILCVLKEQLVEFNSPEIHQSTIKILVSCFNYANPQERLEIFNQVETQINNKNKWVCIETINALTFFFKDASEEYRGIILGIFEKIKNKDSRIHVRISAIKAIKNCRSSGSSSKNNHSISGNQNTFFVESESSNEKEKQKKFRAH